MAGKGLERYQAHTGVAGSGYQPVMCLARLGADLGTRVDCIAHVVLPLLCCVVFVLVKHQTVFVSLLVAGDDAQR